MSTASVPVVQYGRRKGSSRAHAAVNCSEKGPDISMPKTNDLRQVTVLSKADWERIVTSTSTMEKEARQLYEQRKEREAMHLRSKEIVKNWTNTIAGLRQKKLQSKKLFKEQEEEAKRKIDIEEAKFQAEKRKEAIEQARLKQYYQNDKVKNFHSALLLTEVMKEREAQIELNKQMMHLNSKQGKHFHANMQRELEESILNDQAKALQQTVDKKNVASELLKQIEEHQRNTELERITNQKEGDEIQRLTSLHIWEMNKLAKKKEDEKREVMMAHLAHVADRDFLRGLDQQKEAINDKMIQSFVLAKKKMENLKREREVELHRKIVERRDQISELLVAQLKQKVDDEDERTANAIAELETKSKMESQEKEEKIKADIKAITEHRLAMRRRKEMEEKEEKMNALQALLTIKEADALFHAQQREKQQRTEDELKKVQTRQIQQMAEQKTMSLLEREAELNYARQNNIFLAKQEDQFQEYAQQVINAAIKAGRKPYPLKKAAQGGTGGGHGPVYGERGGIRPSYQVQDTSGVQLPAYNNGTTQQIKEMYDSGDIQQGKKKLGFTW
ncbi:cilia- and flagella- associated protein 210-like [Pelodytes ibericus]